jgi:hypothetical protein
MTDSPAAIPGPGGASAAVAFSSGSRAMHGSSFAWARGTPNTQKWRFPARAEAAQ